MNIINRLNKYGFRIAEKPATCWVKLARAVADFGIGVPQQRAKRLREGQEKNRGPGHGAGRRESQANGEGLVIGKAQTRKTEEVGTGEGRARVRDSEVAPIYRRILAAQQLKPVESAKRAENRRWFWADSDPWRKASASKHTIKTSTITPTWTLVPSGCSNRLNQPRTS